MDTITLELLAEFICGDDQQFAPIYRKGWELTKFFEAVGITRFTHDGSTRKWWVLDCLKQCTENEIYSIIQLLSSPRLYRGMPLKQAML